MIAKTPAAPAQIGQITHSGIGSSSSGKACAHENQIASAFRKPCHDRFENIAHEAPSFRKAGSESGSSFLPAPWPPAGKFQPVARRGNHQHGRAAVAAEINPGSAGRRKRSSNGNRERRHKAQPWDRPAMNGKGDRLGDQPSCRRRCPQSTIATECCQTLFGGKPVSVS